MEPTLQDGDVLLVRKSDGLLWDYILNQKEGVERTLERQSLQDFEEVNCSATPYNWLMKKPPTPLTNDIVVFNDPEVFGVRKWNIKRVVGLGGQIVMVSSSRFQSPRAKQYRIDNSDNDTSMRIATTSVSPYSLLVEGDNSSNSYDSRNKKHGAISKKLLVGIAEYRIWPPTRIGLVNEIEPPQPRPQSYWPT
jgi:signal peptidase I